MSSGDASPVFVSNLAPNIYGFEIDTRQLGRKSMSNVRLLIEDVYSQLGGGTILSGRMLRQTVERVLDSNALNPTGTTLVVHWLAGSVKQVEQWANSVRTVPLGVRLSFNASSRPLVLGDIAPTDSSQPQGLLQKASRFIQMNPWTKDIVSNVVRKGVEAISRSLSGEEA